MNNENVTKPVVLVGLEKTLSESTDSNWLGKPIWSMVGVCRYHIGIGHEVRILTSRATNPDDVEAIKNWLVDSAELPVSRTEFNKLASLNTPAKELAITNCITEDVIMVLSQAAFHVVPNIGRIIGLPTLMNSRKPESNFPRIKPFRSLR